MKLNTILIFFIFCAVNFAYGQNKIIRNSGEVIECKILKEDSAKVYFTFLKDGKEISTYMNKNDIRLIQYQITLCTDPIIYRTGKGRYFYYQNGIKLNSDELSLILKTNDQAYEEYLSSMQHGTIAVFLAIGGGGIVGWCLGNYISGKEPDFLLALAGGGMAFLSIPFAHRAEYKMNHAVDIFNEGNKHSQLKNELRFGLNSSGIGFQFTF